VLVIELGVNCEALGEHCLRNRVVSALQSEMAKRPERSTFTISLPRLAEALQHGMQIVARGGIAL